MALRRFLVMALLTAVACGDDDASDGESGSPTSVASQSTSDTSSSGTDPTTSTSASTETSADSSSSGDAPIDVPCGDALVCSGGDVCIEDALDPECTNLEDPKGMCPDGQEMTFCGGAGIPCCCLPPPASEYRCVTPTECIGPATCECLGASLCTDGRVCTSLGADPEHLFRCESPPKP
jgi:hypothetical protein